MKNATYLTIITVAFLFSPAFVRATVGGPTLINSLQYSLVDKGEVLYEQAISSGKGCPPEAYLMNLTSGAKRVLVSCSDLDYWTNPVSYDARLESVLAAYPNLLKHIDLAKNHFSIQVTVTSQQSATAQNGFLGSTNFRLDIFQNSVKKGSFEYSGCSSDQVHVIEGYVIPSMNVLVLLVSTKGDCFEGGYTRETLHTIPGVTLYDQSPLPLKNNREAMSQIGNITLVAARADANPSQSQDVLQPDSNTQLAPTLDAIPTNQTTQTGNSLVFEIIIGVLLLIILILVVRKR